MESIERGGCALWTNEQMRVVYADVQNRVVFAAPGSGKTSVLTHHIGYVVRTNRVSPSEMVAVSFTRQASLELKNRLKQLPNITLRQAESVQVGTFHSIVFHWLLPKYPDIPLILRESEQLDFIRRAVRKAGMSAIHARDVLASMSLVRSTWPPAPAPRALQKVKMEYEHLKRTARRWDFDDILETWCSFRAKHPSQPLPAIKYVLVDEFQDTNPIQWWILQDLMTAGDCRLFVVGDDDQSIYGFRGARPEWLLRFTELVPGSAKHQLTVNFRSDRSIVTAAATLIAHNRMRVAKPMSTSSEELGTCELIRHRDERAQARWLADFLRTRSNSNGVHTTVAVLARTRAELADLNTLCGIQSARFFEVRTFHDSKGREWDEVHLINAVEDNPYWRGQLDGRSVEEERRLFYVAMTRARHALYIHVPKRFGGVRVQPLRFCVEAGFDG
nr:UvrD-helicase domain-containing protein [Alicyclobacillus contaminans]